MTGPHNWQGTVPCKLGTLLRRTLRMQASATTTTVSKASTLQALGDAP